MNCDKEKIKIIILIDKKSINNALEELVTGLKKYFFVNPLIFCEQETLSINNKNIFLSFYQYFDIKLFEKISIFKNPFNLSNYLFKYISVEELKSKNFFADIVIDLRSEEKYSIEFKFIKLFKLNLTNFADYYNKIINRSNEQFTFLQIIDTGTNKKYIYSSFERLVSYSFYINQSRSILGWVHRLPYLMSKEFDENNIDSRQHKPIRKHLDKDTIFRKFIFLKNIFSEILFKFLRHYLGKDKWFIGIQKNDENNNQFQIKNNFSIPSHKYDEYLADPFIFSNELSEYLFCESFSYKANKGVIKVGKVNENRECHKLETVLEEKYHLSFPFIFREKGSFWMIPESANNNTIDLYRSKSFPYGWVKEKTILSGIKAVDSTVLFYEDVFWLFTSFQDKAGMSNDMHIYWSDDLTGDWKPHKKNPIISDVKISRNAGSIFFYNNKIIRPSQNCLRRYGEEIIFSEIIMLNKDIYEEKRLLSISPKHIKNSDGIHTWNMSRNKTIVFDFAKWQLNVMNFFRRLN
tara:strand:+ start:3239 stop:4798 length:1560 start_codon:yes stop_codon:yes gene_type:complete